MTDTKEPAASGVKLSGANLIGDAESALGSRLLYSLDPRSGRQGGVAFHEATSAEVDAACSIAAGAAGEYGALGTDRISSLLATLAEAIDARSAALAETADGETALGKEALQREIRRTTWQLRAFAKVVAAGWHLQAVIDPPDPDFVPVARPDLRRMLVPVGPVAVFAASNVPFAFGVAGGDTASALAAGCPVVVKGHPSHPATSELVARVVGGALRGAGAPAGIFSMVQGASEDVGSELVRHPDIKAVGFTGSLRAGRALHDIAAARDEPIPVYAEMGSINPTFVTRAALDARAEQIGQGLADSITIANGQFCTKPGVVVVPAGEGVARLGEAISARLSESHAGVLLNARIRSELVRQAAELSAIGAVSELAAGNEPDGAITFRPAVHVTDSTTFLSHGELRSEHFGPLALVVTYGSTEQLRDVAAAVPNSLTGTIHAEPSDLDETRVLERLLQPKVGRLIYNGFPTGVAVTHAMQHGGPYPATTAPWSTSVGSAAIFRFMRPVTFQNFPAAVLPPALRDENPLGLLRLVNGEFTTEAVGAT